MTRRRFPITRDNPVVLKTGRLKFTRNDIYWLTGGPEPPPLNPGKALNKKQTGKAGRPTTKEHSHDE